MCCATREHIRASRGKECALNLLDEPQVVAMHIGHSEHMEWLSEPMGLWVDQSHPKVGYTPLGVKFNSRVLTEIATAPPVLKHRQLELMLVSVGHSTQRLKLLAELNASSMDFTDSYPLGRGYICNARLALCIWVQPWRYRPGLLASLGVPDSNSSRSPIDALPFSRSTCNFPWDGRARPQALGGAIVLPTPHSYAITENEATA